MTPAERDEVRRIAQDTIDAHALRDSVTREPVPCSCGSCLCARAVLSYVPAGDVYDCGIEIYGQAVLVPVNAADLRNGMWWHSPATARSRVHALHAAADAAEEMTR